MADIYSCSSLLYVLDQNKRRDISYWLNFSNGEFSAIHVFPQVDQVLIIALLGHTHIYKHTPVVTRRNLWTERTSVITVSEG